ncbi:ATP-dependent Clp protease proteolytic subunit [uncultured Thomasclavelia sp.]|uniref:ATP-dependent Clp protease proteolytic subunit n=1 Tax=uncultured Thomasclavelia sp. TaxID=3025759 RepID=UPI0025D1338C|nr:ATP-dependent Clp protease proteolytic subunit [uncultured Thomasclavelia sp.]
MHIVPTVIEKTNQREYAYDIYSRLLEDRIILLTGTIDDKMASSIVGQLLYLESLDNNSDIFMYINSPGGSINAGFAIYDTMNFIKCDVSTIVIGMAASMAAFLLSAGTKGKRRSLPNSEIMIHQPLGAYEGQASDIEISAKRILRQKNKLNRILSQNTNQPLAKIEKDTDRDFFLDPVDAMQYGLIDEII